ncbi:MAG TPA: ornithine carbamoyltransferase [Lentisphaeria bacterium]|nr:MAG: ornithine carbamoyltransferase [Lentisphaerae bacterium GWF2_38_69]HBM16359.1 ornithine carbamoyltransferase [Lentisphaeria bacterium]
MKDFLRIKDLYNNDIIELMKQTAENKASRGKNEEKILSGKTIGLIFAKPSTRTRVSFEVAINEMGGHCIFLNHKELQLGKSETLEDTATVLSRYIHGLIIRTYAQSDVQRFAKNSSFPVINALTNEYHPCQAFCDLFTIFENTNGTFKNIRVAFLGDGACNVANSLADACRVAGMKLTIASPEKFAPNPNLIKECIDEGVVNWVNDPIEAVKNADFIYTDTWVSMGFESDAQDRLQLIRPYQVNAKLMSHAPSHAKVMHCLPANRNFELTDEVIDGPQSIVFDQAENRLHGQKTILKMLYGN